MQGQLPRIKQDIFRCRRVGTLADTLRTLNSCEAVRLSDLCRHSATHSRCGQKFWLFPVWVPGVA